MRSYYLLTTRKKSTQLKITNLIAFFLHLGNDYSYRHREFPLSSNNFWNFSFHEIGIYDVTAMVDYVTNQTGNPKVNYIGFSM